LFLIVEFSLAATAMKVAATFDELLDIFKDREVP
jgi:hypothetical protein